MRTILKGAAERAIVWSGAAALHRRRMSRRVLILAYHNIVPDDAPPIGDLANHLPLTAFLQQLDALRRTHHVVPLMEALAAPSRHGDRPRVVITFDDAYRGALAHGLPALAAREMPATIFVAPAFIGGRSFWWDALARPGAPGLDPVRRERALAELRGEDAAVRAWALRDGVPLEIPPAVACAASEKELASAAAAPGVTLGAHSFAHPSLTRLSDAELAAELEQPLAWLRARFRNVVPVLAYPYGHFDGRVERAARAAGYDAALAVSGGWLSDRPAHPFALPRVNVVPGLSVHGFALRAAGLLSG